jgi:hypothetical protein
MSDRERRNTMVKIMYKAGERASGGNYWNFSNGERICLSNESILPGDNGATYVKAHPVMILAAGPVLGLVYAAFLPFIGIAMLLKVVLTKVFGGSLEGATKVATFNWSPSRAFLAGKRAKKAKGKDEKTPEPEEDKGKQE